MKTLSKLYESYINLLDKDAETKRTYSDVVWNLLQSSYASQGGIHGSGFESKESMIKNIPIWKLVRKGNNIVAGAMYKTKNGRKRVAIFTDGTQAGKDAIMSLNRDEIKTGRSYQEISGRSLSVMSKIEGFKESIMPVELVKEILKGDRIDTNIETYDEMLIRFPELKQFMYRRKIGDEYHTKIMIGKYTN